MEWRGQVLVFNVQFLQESTGILKKLLKTTKSKNKKHSKIVLIARSKLNSIGSKISETLISNEISHENFMAIIKKKALQ